MPAQNYLVARGGEVVSEVLAAINELPGAIVIGPRSDDTGSYLIKDILQFQLITGLDSETGRPYHNIFALVQLEPQEPSDAVQRIAIAKMMEHTPDTGEEDARYIHPSKEILSE